MSETEAGAAGATGPARRKKPTIDDVAQRAGVSVATVSRILNGVKNKASTHTRERVLDAIAELHYRPVRVGRALSMMQSPLVALLTPDTTNAFYASIADGVQAAINATGNAMILCNTREDPVTQDAYIEEMQSHLVSGIALLGAVETPGLERVLDEGPPVVFVNRKCPFDRDSIFVGIDNYGAGRAVADYFISRNYRSCAALHGPLNSSASRERFYGFRDGLGRAGIILEDRYVLGAELTIESGYRQASRLFDNGGRPRAVFSGNDPIAYGAYRRCRELGLRVPEDVALFGFDDNPLNEWLAPWLSTVHVPYAEFGAKVAEIFRKILSNRVAEVPKQTLVPHRLVIRSSA